MLESSLYSPNVGVIPTDTFLYVTKHTNPEMRLVAFLWTGGPRTESKQYTKTHWKGYTHVIPSHKRAGLNLAPISFQVKETRYIYVLSKHLTIFFPSILFLPLALCIFCFFKTPFLWMILCCWRAILDLRRKTEKSISFCVYIYIYVYLNIHIHLSLRKCVYENPPHLRTHQGIAMYFYVYLHKYTHTHTPFHIDFVLITMRMKKQQEGAARTTVFSGP